MRLLLVLLCSMTCTSLLSQDKTQVTLLFEFGKTTLIPQSKEKLNSLLQELQQKTPASITIIGHTDKSGSESFNQNLSMARAESIAQMLQLQFPQTTIKTEAQGMNQLLTAKDEEQQLNRRVIIIIEYPIQEPPTIEIEPYKQDVEEQRFKVDLNKEISITAKEGTFIKIAPGSIQNKNGQLMNGEAELIIKEYYHPCDMILAGMHTVSDKGLLQTGGMLYITIVQNGDTMSATTRRKIELKMPTINPQLNNMNVFTMTQTNDTTSAWQNTGTRFRQVNNAWEIPLNLEIEDIRYEGDRHYFNQKVGYVHEENFKCSYSWITTQRILRPSAKKVKQKITKIDSATLKVEARIKYRRHAYKALNRWTLDTTFYVKAVTSQYIALTENMNWINCDRFYDYDQKIDFFANTPGFKGANVIVYFKSINAYLPAMTTGNRSVIKNVPPGLRVVIIAMGMRGNDLYFGKQSLVTGNKIDATIALEKVSSEKEMKDLVKKL